MLSRLLALSVFNTGKSRAWANRQHFESKVVTVLVKGLSGKEKGG
jgi:hypothetical protein